MVTKLLALTSQHTHRGTNKQEGNRCHRLALRQNGHLGSRTQRVTLVNNTTTLLHFNPDNVSNINKARRQLTIAEQTRRQLSRTQVTSFQDSNTRLFRQTNGAVQYDQRTRFFINRCTRTLTIRTSHNSFNTQRRLNTHNHDANRRVNNSNLCLKRSSIQLSFVRRYLRFNNVHRVRHTMFVHRLLNQDTNVKIDDARPYTRSRRFGYSLLTRLTDTRGRRTNKILTRQYTRQTINYTDYKKSNKDLNKGYKEKNKDRNDVRNIFDRARVLP